MNAKEFEVLLWKASIIGFGMLIFSFLMMWGLYDFVTSIHAYIFPNLTAADMASDMYLMYGTMKILLITLFVIPAMALYWQRKSKS